LVEPVLPVVSSPGFADVGGEGGMAGTPLPGADMAQLLLQWEGARIALRRTFEDLVTTAFEPGVPTG
jgi:hypothetical protein